MKFVRAYLQEHYSQLPKGANNSNVHQRTNEKQNEVYSSNEMLLCHKKTFK